MAVLKQVFPLLAERLSRAEDTSTLKVEAADSGVPTLVIDGLYIHSKRDPVREAERLVEAVTGEEGTPALVLGFGLGYIASALAGKFPARPIIVVEKQNAVLKMALEVRDLTEFLARKQLAFVLDIDGVDGALSLFEGVPGVPPLVMRNRALTGLDGEWYAGVENKITAWNTRTNVNRATQKRFGKRWVKNLSKNLPAVRDIPGISCLEGILKNRDIPVFLAAAGPSLDQAIPFLDEIHKRCLIVAVDTSQRFLLTHGIDPDFALSIDPQYWNVCHLNRASSPKTRLVAESAVYPTLLQHPFGGFFFCGSFFPLGRFIEGKVDPKGELGAGGSVATSAWDFARLLGTATVWISGLDLSFPELKTHFRGALFEEKSNAESCRFSPCETGNFRLLRDGQPFYAKRSGGGLVLTDKRLFLYAAWFENRFRRFPEVRNLSLLPGGLEIKGLECGKAEDLLALPERREVIDSLLKEVFTALEEDFYSEKAKESRAKSYKNARTALFSGLEEVKSQALAAEELAVTTLTRVKLGHLGENERERTLEKLDSTNKAITNSAVKEIAGFLLQEIEGWEAEIASETPDPLTRHLEFSSRFYRALAEAAEFNLKTLKTG